MGTSIDKVSHSTFGTQMYRGNTYLQTNPIKQVDIGINTNLSYNFSSKTAPRSFYTQTSNTPNPIQTSTQTEPRTSSNQPTITPHSYETSIQTKHGNNNEQCQREIEEMTQLLLPFHSNFARQLTQNEVMRGTSVSIPLQLNNVD